jgi:hypothetical protein
MWRSFSGRHYIIPLGRIAGDQRAVSRKVPVRGSPTPARDRSISAGAALWSHFFGTPAAILAFQLKHSVCHIQQQEVS